MARRTRGCTVWDWSDECITSRGRYRRTFRHGSNSDVRPTCSGSGSGALSGCRAAIGRNWSPAFFVSPLSMIRGC